MVRTADSARIFFAARNPDKLVALSSHETRGLLFDLHVNVCVQLDQRSGIPKRCAVDSFEKIFDFFLDERFQATRVSPIFSRFRGLKTVSETVSKD